MAALGSGYVWQMKANNLIKQGYVYQFACTYNGGCPNDLGYTGHEDGWETRRKIKAWCASNGITDYQILRNAGWVKDLHGPAVYELYVRERVQLAAPTLAGTERMP